MPLPGLLHTRDLPVPGGFVFSQSVRRIVLTEDVLIPIETSSIPDFCAREQPLQQ